MATITVPYQIVPHDYEIEGDVRSGLRATVTCKLAWSDAITFVNEVLVAPQAERVGLITWNAPLQFPSIGLTGANSTPPIYCQGFRIRPQGAGNAGTITPNGGLAPGEFFDTAFVTLRFESVTYINQTGDDPGFLNQLDPENPITACEQSVKLRGKMRSTKGRGYVYKTSGKPVLGDFAVPETEAILVLKFPRVPYLPWQLVAPYVGKANSQPMLGCATGALLLEGLDTDVTPGTNGTLQQKAVLEFAVNLPGSPQAGGYGAVGTDWNMQPINDGSGDWDYVVAASNTSITPLGYADFRNIFNSLAVAD